MARARRRQHPTKEAYRSFAAGVILLRTIKAKQTHMHRVSPDPRWNSLIEAYRSEIIAYVELLELFRDVAGGGTDAGASTLRERVAGQMRLTHERRQEREQEIAALASRFGKPVETPLQTLLKDCDQSRRPMLEELGSDARRLAYVTRREAGRMAMHFWGRSSPTREL